METTTTLTWNALSPLITAAILRFPQTGERAVKAAELLLSGKVQRLADDSQGLDCWAVYGTASGMNGESRPYHVSIKAGTCDCGDQAAERSPKGQKMCKHMQACMFAFKLGITSPATPSGLLAHILSGAETSVKLYVREEWTGEESAIQSDFCVAYRIDDAADRVELAERVECSMNTAIYETIDSAGWQRSKRYASHGGLHVWELTPKPVAVDWPQPAAQPQPKGEALFAETKLNRGEDMELWA